MNQCAVTLDLNEYFSTTEANESSFAYTKADKQAEVIEFADRLIKGVPVRVVKYWATHSLLTWADVVDEVINDKKFEELSRAACNGNGDALTDLYRRTTQRMIAIALFDESTADDLGFLSC